MNKLSVLMTAHNAMPYLAESVDSVLRQSYSKYDFFIINDGSSDDTENYITSLRDNRIHYFSIPKNGIITALNFGLSKIESEFVAIMDADDICLPDRLEQQLIFLESNMNCGLVGSNFSYFSKSYSTNSKTRKWGIKLPENDAEIKQGLEKGRYVIAHPTIMFRLELIRKINGYSENSYPVPDYDLYLRLMRITNFFNIQKSLCNIRLSEKSFTARLTKEILEKKKFLIGTNFEKPVNPYKSNISKIKTYFEFISLKLYRKGIINYCNSRRSYLFWLALSSVLSPVKAFYYLFYKVDFFKK